MERTDEEIVRDLEEQQMARRELKRYEDVLKHRDDRAWRAPAVTEAEWKYAARARSPVGSFKPTLRSDMNGNVFARELLPWNWKAPSAILAS